MDFNQLMDVPDFKEWYQERPTVIQKAIQAFPPSKTYRFKDSKYEFQIMSYEEPLDEKDEVTITVQKTGRGGVYDVGSFGRAMGVLGTNRVFGVSLTDIEPIPKTQTDVDN